MGKKRRDGRASKRGNSASSSNAGARNSGGGVQQFALRYLGGIYKGDIKHGKPHGKGRIEFEDGEFYEGDWRDGMRHGRGLNKLANGSVYEGEFASPLTSGDSRHGWGIMTWPSGQVYEGQWEDGNENGRGTMTYANGDVYVGQWRDNEKHGRGTMTCTNGDVYDGDFVDGQQHGQGTMKYSSGTVHEGEWEDGERHGKGRTKLPTGDVCDGIWVNGKVSSIYFPNADTRNDDAVPKAAAGRELLGGRKLRSQRSQKNRPETAKKACEHCGVDDYLYKLRVCSGCNLALYCSAACQKAASRSHRRICSIASMLPPQNANRLALVYNKDNIVDLDAGLRYATKYMDSLKHLKIDFRTANGDALKLSAKQLSSLLKSKKGALESVTWVPSGHIDIPGITENGYDVWKELCGLKHLRLECMKFDDVQSLRDIICQQKDTLEVICLPGLNISWYTAKCRRMVAAAVGSCKHLVRLSLAGCVLMDADLKVMLQDLPNLRILNLERDTDNSHEFTDNTCGLIARKCPGLQELNLYYHDHLSVRGIRKIFQGCPHLRAFYTTAHKLSCNDVRSLLDVAPQLMYLSFDGGISFSAEELDEIIEATGGRTVLRFGLRVDAVYVPKEEGVPAKTREKYLCQLKILSDVCSRTNDLEVSNWFSRHFQ